MAENPYHRNKAVELLQHYLLNYHDASPGSDNYAEVEQIVEHIIEAAKDAIKEADRG